MSANNAPMFTRLGHFYQGVTLQEAATTDYQGISANTREVWGGFSAAGAIEGSFIERLRFKSLGTNVQTVARIFLNRDGINTQFATAPSTPTGTPSSSGGTMLTGNYYARVVAIGPKGSQSALSAASSVQAVAGPTGSITWNWNDVPGATEYHLYVGYSATSQTRMFVTTTSGFTQTTPPEDATSTNNDPLTGNQALYGEITLPATTAVANAATPDIDYYMNIALAPGTEVYVGLGTAVSAGWHVTAIGGIY